MEQTVSRRHLFKALAGAVAPGVGVAVVSEALSPAPAAAATMTASSGTGAAALTAVNSSTGVAIDADITDPNSGNNVVMANTVGKGAALRGEINNTANAIPATFGTTNGTGAGVHGRNTGTGAGVVAEITNVSNGEAALYAVTSGWGNAITAWVPRANVDGEVFYGENAGYGYGMHMRLTNPDSGSIAVYARTAGRGTGVQGQSAEGVGVMAMSQGDGAGLWATSERGPSVVVQGYGRAHLCLLPTGQVGPRTDMDHRRGEIVVDKNADMWLCKAGSGNDPGTWLRVGYNPIDPARIVDTRPGSAPVSHGDTALAQGEEMLVDIVGVAGVPVGATAVTLNVTAVGPTSSGYLSLYPAHLSYSAAAPPAFSNVNFGPGHIVANQATVKVAPPETANAGKIKVFNSRGATHVILDVAGFYS